ncbi:DNA polymerase III subunit gamma/tau [Patescibacteria group bacterium]|nr:DNA polymerase III subunit gamma/tau [Patescibacteria group bacterium]MBU1931615.1 DNA polymerase III subunit gamma/tau [Patescibacteria group bacterium]
MTNVFYLKYRPQKIIDLDLSSIRQQLTELLASEKLPHAFLFTGPKGTGKTSSARIVAKAINCLQRTKGQIEPCNRCSACKSIMEGQAMDLIEIDAASNRGIDDIRDLKQKIRLTPAVFKYKVYIIDEVHMLTTEAFNALLKTLEEPPSHAVFILCTTEPHKLPDTIVSRCLHFKFRRANKIEIIRSLKRVAKSEALKVEPAVLDLISQASDGSFRDAVKVLEQLSFKSKKITQKQALVLLGEGDEVEFLKFLAKRVAKPALSWLNDKLDNGADLKHLGASWLDLLRRSLLACKGLDQELPSGLPDFNEAELKQLLTLFSRAALESKTAVIPHLPYELAVIEWSSDKVKNDPPKADTFTCPQSLRSSAGRRGPAGKVQNEEPAVLPEPDKQESSASTPKLQEVQSKWNQILSLVRPQNHSVEALLKAARPTKLEGNTLMIEVFYPFHKSRLETERCRLLVEEAVEKTLAQKTRVCYVLSNKLKPVIKKKAQPLSIDPTEILSQAAEEIFNN